MYMRCAFLVVRLLSTIEILVSTATIVCGCLALDYAWPNREWPIASGVGIWAGAVVLASGVCGFVASCLTPDSHEGHQKRLFVAHCTLANFSYATSLLCIGLSIWIQRYCSGNGNYADWCYPNESQNRQMAFVLIVMGALLIASAIPVSISFCIVLSKFNSRVDNFDSVTTPVTSRSGFRGDPPRSWSN